MKSAYELAMERLEKQAPSAKITGEQKQAIAEVESQYKAKIAERELFLKQQLQAARQGGNVEEIGQIERQLAVDLRRLREDCEEKKEAIRKQTH